MIKKADEMISEIKQQMRGGKGSVEIVHIFKQEELKGKARLIAKISLNQGCSIGIHEHIAEEEIFYIINGIGIINDNGSEQSVSAGDAILTGNGAFHSIENREDTPLQLLALILVY